MYHHTKHAVLSGVKHHFSDYVTQALGEFSYFKDSVQAAHFGSSVIEWYIWHTTMRHSIWMNLESATSDFESIPSSRSEALNILLKLP